MPVATRRDVLHGLVQAAGTAGMLGLALKAEAFAAPVAPIAEAWAQHVTELARDFRLQALSPMQWQEATEQLNQRVPLHELLSYIDFERVAERLRRQALTELDQTIWIPGIEWKAHRIWTAIFILPPGQAVPPHGHNGFVGAHLVLQGQLHARTFDRIADEPGRMRLRPRSDGTFAPGDTVSMSEDRGNVHWFIGGDMPTFTFDINVVSTQKRDYANRVERQGRIYIAPEPRPDDNGLIEAAVIPESRSRDIFGSAEAYRRFG
jgi:hypothetical protein